MGVHALPVADRPSRVPGGRPTVASRLVTRCLRRVPVLVSRTAAVLGVLCLLDAFGRRATPAVDWFTPLVPAARLTAQAVVTVCGLLLLRIAAGLRRRKRAEWRVAVGLCAAISVAHLVRGERRPVEAVVALALLATLVAARGQFAARADPRSRWFAARVCAQFLAVAIGYGTVSLELPGHVPGRVPLAARVREVLASLVGVGGRIPVHDDRYADVFHATMLAFGLLAVACAVILLVRPPAPVASLAAADECRLRALLGTEGSRDSLGYFALRRDKSVVWSPTGKAAVTYRVVCGVALASGDPIGDPEAWPGAITAYRKLVEESGWTPAVMGCGERAAAAFRRWYGLSALALGDEAVVEVAGFSLAGRAMRGVRQACARLARDGYRVSLHRVSELDAAQLTEVRAVAERWRGNGVERGFSMALSRLGDPADGDCVVVTAYQDGQLRGLLHFVPWGPSGLSLDLMRRDRAAGNGLNELMIATVLRECAGTGVTRISLNFAVFREPLERGERIGAGPLLRARRAVLLLASRWWQIDSLYRFNAKFGPRWEPRFVLFPQVRDIPRIALAVLEAEAFIVRPRRLNRLLGRP